MQAVTDPSEELRPVPRWRDLLAPLAVVVAMVTACGAAGHVDAIFPELAALAVGAWCFRLPAWQRHPWQLFFLPSAIATMGIAIQRWSGWSRAPEEAVIGTVAVLALAAIDSAVAPALSAGLLPVVLGISSWLYPLTVVLSTALVAGLVMWKNRSARRSRPPALPDRQDEPRCSDGATTRQYWPWPMAGWFLLAVWAAITLSAVTGVPLLALPPLFVAAFDQVRIRVLERRPWWRSIERAARDVVLLEIAAALAVGARVGLGGPTEGAVVGFVVVAALALWWRVELLPLFPVAILPALLPSAQLGVYLWAVPAEAALLGLLVSLLPVVRGVKTARCNPAPPTPSVTSAWLTAGSGNIGRQVTRAGNVRGLIGSWLRD